MPYDSRADEALRVMSRNLASFESAVALTAEDVRHVLERIASPVEDRAQDMKRRLGKFAEYHVDAERFASLIGSDEPMSRPTAELVESALVPLDGLAKGTAESCVIHVGPNGTLYDAVSSVLSRVGRAFGAARLVQSIKTGQYRLNDHARSLGAFPFSRWNSGERGVAPPIIVEVPGSQVRAGALSEFMDGQLKIILIVHGNCSPVPLVRLISPGTFVAQVQDVADLEELATWSGPGIAAVVPEQCALFVHDPRGGQRTWERVTVRRMPDTRLRKPVAGLSAAQQSEEIELLSMLSKAPDASAPVSEEADHSVADPADKLAAWLLAQADLSGSY